MMNVDDTKLILIGIISLINTLYFLKSSKNFLSQRISGVLSLGFFRFLWIDVLLYACDIVLSNTVDIVFGGHQILGLTNLSYTVLTAVVYFILCKFADIITEKNF